MTTKQTDSKSETTQAKSRSGQIEIHIGINRKNEWEVWALRTGTHDLLPVTRSFPNRDAARAYANDLWRYR